MSYNPITLRPPTTSPLASTAAASQGPPAPNLDFLVAKWHVTHSTLPMWKKNRNVTITYTPLASSSSTAPTDSSPPLPQLDDLVEYQPVGSAKQKTVRGVDTPEASGPGAGGWAWNWRGRGLLKVASSRWEVLGYGAERGGNRWVVTYFAKTLFTPAGIDIYSAEGRGLDPGTVEGIRVALNGFDDDGLRKLAGELFEVKIDRAE